MSSCRMAAMEGAVEQGGLRKVTTCQLAWRVRCVWPRKMPGTYNGPLGSRPVYIQKPRQHRAERCRLASVSIAARLDSIIGAWSVDLDEARVARQTLVR